jgi:hypothetical protein
MEAKAVMEQLAASPALVQQLLNALQIQTTTGYRHDGAKDALANYRGWLRTSRDKSETETLRHQSFGHYMAACTGDAAFRVALQVLRTFHLALEKEYRLTSLADAAFLEPSLDTALTDAHASVTSSAIMTWVHAYRQVHVSTRPNGGAQPAAGQKTKKRRGRGNKNGNRPRAQAPTPTPVTSTAGAPAAPPVRARGR